MFYYRGACPKHKEWWLNFCPSAKAHLASDLQGQPLYDVGWSPRRLQPFLKYHHKLSYAILLVFSCFLRRMFWMNNPASPP